MNKFHYLFLILLIHLSCETDDICSETNPSTPQLVIRLYDTNQPSQPKSVDTLRITAKESNSVLQFIDADSIAIPFRINSDQMNLDFTISGGKNDELSIDYQTEDVYLSRACGFQSRFVIDNIKILGNPDWMNAIETLTKDIQIDTLAHVKIYH